MKPAPPVTRTRMAASLPCSARRPAARTTCRPSGRHPGGQRSLLALNVGLPRIPCPRIGRRRETAVDYPPPPGRHPRLSPGRDGRDGRDGPPSAKAGGLPPRDQPPSAPPRGDQPPGDPPRGGQPYERPPHDEFRRSRDVHESSRPQATRRGNTPLTTAKSVIAAISVLVLVATGYGWTTLQRLNNGLTTTNVIELHAADGATDILLVGNDSRVDAKGNPLPKQVLAELRAGDNEGELTDTLILLRIPNDGKRAVAISLPRDAYVSIAGGYGRHKIN